LAFSAILIVAALIAGASWAARATAQSATPPIGADSAKVEVLTLVEHNDHTTDVDVGDSGPSAGDLRVWGPNPLYDEANSSDTGATTQGSCVALDASFSCVLVETIVFPDGSTLQFQGVELEGTTASVRTIVGGSGAYLGATGIAAVAPTDDFSLWTRTIEIIRS
jgi:hypothetical protein